MLRFTERFLFVNTAVNNSGNLLSIITCVKIYCLSEYSWNDYSYDLGQLELGAVIIPATPELGAVITSVP